MRRLMRLSSTSRKVNGETSKGNNPLASTLIGRGFFLSGIYAQGGRIVGLSLSEVPRKKPRLSAWSRIILVTHCPSLVRWLNDSRINPAFDFVSRSIFSGEKRKARRKNTP